MRQYVSGTKLNTQPCLARGVILARGRKQGTRGGGVEFKSKNQIFDFTGFQHFDNYKVYFRGHSFITSYRLEVGGGKQKYDTL